MWPIINLLTLFTLSFWSILVGLSFSTKEPFKLDFHGPHNFERQ